MTSESEHDVIIVGASFAGLAAAYFIEGGKILVIERKKELGSKQKSTCCTSLGWMEKLNCKGSVRKTFDYLTIHSSKGHHARIKLPQTFCTLDYKKFCTDLAGNLENAEVLTGQRVIELESNASNTVRTKNDKFRGKVLVDCSGWAGVKGNHQAGLNGDRGKKPSFGLEVETEFQGDTESFHIYYGKKFISQGYAWIFPTGKETARIGVGGYSGFKPKETLNRFLELLDIKKMDLTFHGGYLPCLGLNSPVRDTIFIVGDACNQVLPLSGEGIRKTLEYAEICGGIISRILQDKLSLKEGLKTYSQEVLKTKKFYDNLNFAQTLATYCPDWSRNRIIKTLSNLDEIKTEGLLLKYFSDEITSSKTSLLKTVIKGMLA
jgi:flavin-dependent dehydrogenase